MTQGLFCCRQSNYKNLAILQSVDFSEKKSGLCPDCLTKISCDIFVDPHRHTDFLSEKGMLWAEKRFVENIIKYSRMNLKTGKVETHFVKKK